MQIRYKLPETLNVYYLRNLLLKSCNDFCIKGACSGLLDVEPFWASRLMTTVEVVVVVGRPDDDVDDDDDGSPLILGIWFLIVFLITVVADIALFLPPGS